MYLHLIEPECDCPGCAGIVAPGLGAAPPVELLADAQAQQRTALEDLLDVVGKLALLVNLARK